MLKYLVLLLLVLVDLTAAMQGLGLILGCGECMEGGGVGVVCQRKAITAVQLV